MSEEITSLKALEYFEGQCFAYFEISQIHNEEKEKVQGVFSYQEGKISFSFMFEYMGKIEEPHLLYANPKYKTLYILTNKKTYTIHNPCSQKTSGYSLGHPTQITLHYEWLFNDWIDPEAIKGEHLICRTNYLESFLTTNQHLLYERKTDENKCKNQYRDKDKDFILRSFYIQNDFLSDKFKNDRIRVKPFYTLSAPEQHRFFSCQYDLHLECDIAFEDLDRLALSAEAIKNFFVLIYAYSDFEVQIDYIQFKFQNSEEYITAVKNTYKKDKKPISIDSYGIAIQFWEIDNFSAVLEKWIDFYIQNKDFQYVPSILDIINKKGQTIHLYLDIFLLISMIEGFVEQQQFVKIDEETVKKQTDRIDKAIKILSQNHFSNEELQQYKNSLEYGITKVGLGKKLSTFFKLSLSNTMCEKTKAYFTCKKRAKLTAQILKYRNILAHGKKIQIDKDKAIEIANNYANLKQIVIDYFFGEIGLSKFIKRNNGFSRLLDRRNYIFLQNQEGKVGE